MTEINGAVPREYFYAKNDDVHGDNATQSSIDRNDNAVNSIFTTNIETAKAMIANSENYQDQNKFRLVDTAALQNKIVNVYNSLIEKFTGVTYDTDTQEKANAADAQFDKEANNIHNDVKSQIAEAIKQAEAEIKDISVTNANNQKGTIKGQVSYTKDGNGNITGMAVISDSSGNGFRYQKAEDGKFYQVDADGNRVKDKAGNEKAYTLDDNGNLVRDNSNAKPAKPAKTKPASEGSGNRPAASNKVTVTSDSMDENGNRTIKYSNGNERVIYDDGDVVDITYAKFDNGSTDADTFTIHNKKGKLVSKGKFTNYTDGSHYVDSTYHNGNNKNRITRWAVDTENNTITNKDQAAKKAELRLSAKYKGYYTDGKNFYRWNQEDSEFVMVTHTSLKNKFGFWNKKCE